MQKYNFDRIINRIGTNSYKWDSWDASAKDGKEGIALWVADMDFETAPCIMEALKKRMEHGCFGYTMVHESYYQASINWFARRHGWQMEREWFIYTSGVVPAISAIIKAMTQPGDKVLIQTPVYNCFFSSIRNNDCITEEMPANLDDFEKHCADPKVKVFLLCNPHNPTGHVWRKEELAEMAEICHRHDVFVIADEIHCEFVNANAMRDGYLTSYIKEDTPKYHPFMAVSDAPCAVCVSPSKAFNIAGLQIANIIIKDDSTRRRVNRAININEVCDVNPFGVIALEAAYSAEGAEWLDDLTHYIYANYDFAKAFIEQHLPQWKVTTLEGTYLMWVKVDTDADALCSRLLEEANVYVNSGTMYDHGTEGHHFIRINLATQRKRLEEGLKRIAENVKGE